MDIEELSMYILGILRDRYNMDVIIIKAKKSESRYIKINGIYMIRISDHYSHRDSCCKYNIGSHVKSFHKLKGAFYYQKNSFNELIHRVVKDELISKKKHCNKKNKGGM